jgi:hypothetical protein
MFSFTLTNFNPPHGFALELLQLPSLLALVQILPLTNGVLRTTLATQSSQVWLQAMVSLPARLPLCATGLELLTPTALTLPSMVLTKTHLTPTIRNILPKIKHS